MSKRLIKNTVAQLTSKKVKMSSTNGTGGGVEIDEDLHSRQLAVYGRDSMRKMAAAKVLVVGAGALGAEVAKNVILAGVKAVTLQDVQEVRLADLSAQFYLSKENLGENRAEACISRLQELNPAVEVKAATCDACDETFLKDFDVVVATTGNLGEAQEMDRICHGAEPNSIPFIRTEICGLFASVFTDFGKEFTVVDTDGEQPFSGIVAAVTPGKTTLVSCVEDERLEFQDGMLVEFSEVEGMVEMNTEGPFRVTDCMRNSFRINVDSTEFGDYIKGGIVTQKKEPKTLAFKTLSEALVEHGEFLLTDFSKLDRSPLLHLAFQALDAFKVEKGRYPAPGNSEDGDHLIVLTQKLNNDLMEPVTVDEDLLKHFASGSSAELNPMAAMFGGVVGQEVVKSVSGKFHPLYQWLYFDSAEALPTEPLPAEELQPIGSRYDHQMAVFGKTKQAEMARMKVFLVGAGALGCEFLKNFAMMGVACGDGICTVTDDDQIEKSNLSRQFLFRDWDIGQPKSRVAGNAAVALNPEFNVKPLQDRVDPKTGNIFDDAFWETQDLVVNALDNVQARLFVDSKCVYYCKPLLESGTLGPKCNTQVVIPHMTENYGASRDPPEPGAPMCTVHSFPHNIDHCLTWARSEFQGMLESRPAEANVYLKDPEAYKTSVLESPDARSREKIETVVETLTQDFCKTFDECIKSARLRFEENFHNKIAQLIYTFPEDATTSTQTPFWSAPKRFPHVLNLDENDASHASLIQALSFLIAEIYGVERPDWATDMFKVLKAAIDLDIPKFVPKDGVYIETDPNKTERNIVECEDEKGVIKRLLSKAEAACAAFPAGFSLMPIKFEKDDDTNYHMDVINGLSNMRARNYKIEEVDKLKAKFIAGRIIPAIATATAMATGLVCLELYKVVQHKKVEAYRNTFANLAVPLFAMAEPIPSKTTTFGDMSWSLWDRWTLRGDYTVNDALEHFRKKGLEVYSISFGPSLLYNNIFPNHKMRMQEKLSSLVRTVGKYEIPDEKDHFDVVMACEDMEEGTDLDIPLITIKFR